MSRLPTHAEKNMWRNIVAFVAGLIAWVAVGYVLFVVMRAIWPEYAASEPVWAFTLSMQLLRLLIGVLCSVAAGCVVALILRRKSRVPWILGGVLVAGFIPVHVQLWDKFPIWYHAFFLLTLIPLIGFGAWLVSGPVGSKKPSLNPS
jgi:hypothetical protein